MSGTNISNHRQKRVDRRKCPTLCRLIVRSLLNERLTAPEAVLRLGLNISVRTVQRVQRNEAHFEYMRMQSCPFHTPAHRQKRLLWAKEMMVKDSDFWRKVTFMDKKKWCSYGPEGFNYYWADVSLPREIYAKRPNVSVGIMIRARISWRGGTELAFIINKVGAVQYCRILDKVCQNYVEE